MGKGWGSVPVESAIRANPPCVDGWGWAGSNFARHNQRFVHCSLGRLERGGGYGAKISASGRVDVNVEGLHGCGLV